MSELVTLMPFCSPDLALLDAWLKRSHVAPWYPYPEENLEWAAAPPKGGSHVLITARSAAVGYMRWQIVDRHTLDSVGLSEIPSNAVDIDLLLGERGHIGQGLGPAALEELVKLLSDNPEIPVAGLTSSAENAYAHAAFRKASFAIACQYSPPGFGPYHLFLRWLRP